MIEPKTLIAYEQELHRADIRKSQRVAELLADDFVEYGRSGAIYRKADTLAALQHEVGFEIQASDFSVVQISADVMQVLYRTENSQETAGKPLFALRSSLWRLRDGLWQMVFHQATPCARPV
ncbi:DUF4440 domain-containing protein [Silvimonas sp. JCM 19000]